MVEMRLYNGQHSMVPIGDVQQHIGFEAIPDSYVPQEMADQVNAAFEKTAGIGKYYAFEMSEGHIKSIRYNPTYQIMQVEFTNNGATVTFFRVPKGLYQELESHGLSNSKMRGIDGTFRHSVGIRFWDLVRIRGQRVGGRYPFTYASSGNLSAGSEPGKYAEMQLRTVGEREQQPVDAEREATIVHKEQPDKAEAADIAKEQVAQNLREALKGKNFLPVQEKRITNMRDILIDKYSVDSPAYREFSAAVERGSWTAIMNVAKLYNLKVEVPKGALE
jgi:hypothetical protein